MLHIERMRMQLPAGYGHRASSIARLVGESLADIQPSESRNLEHLNIGPVEVSNHATDHDIANSVTQRIVAMLRSEV
jgi:hypothetical protein